MKKAQLREQATAHGLQEIPLAVVAEGRRRRVYLEADKAEIPTLDAPPAPEIDQPITDDKRWFSPPQYGLPSFRDLFTPRQLTALVTFSDLVGEARAKVLADAKRTGHLPDDDTSLHQGGSGPQAYADAVATYLAFAIDKGSNYWSTLCGWHSGRDIIMSTFGRQALPMVWDFAEANPICSSTGNVLSGVESCARSLDGARPNVPCTAKQGDAVLSLAYNGEMIATDPPYYDNIGYADLSDFFYVWLRRNLRDVYPDLLSTMLTPKTDELIASHYRHDGSKARAAEFFEKGLGSAIGQWRRHGRGDYPTTIFYAFKQAETDAEGTASTGWETFLAGVIAHGFSITATWPMRTELTGNLKKNVSALASSIVLACIPRLEDAPLATRREFADALRAKLPDAIRNLQMGNVAPVDLAQASIGPGMACFSQYSKVVNADGTPMSVREALQLINQVLDEALSEQESDFDADTRFAIKWFEQYGQNVGPFGDAETLAKAMAVSVKGVEDSGIVKQGAGKVRLLKREEMDGDWDPQTDNRLTIWEVTQHLIRRLETGGEQGAADLLRRVGAGAGETARELAYRLYQTCERKKWADEARSYNGLVVSWPEIERLARERRAEPAAPEPTLFEE